MDSSDYMVSLPNPKRSARSARLSASPTLPCPFARTPRVGCMAALHPYLRVVTAPVQKRSHSSGSGGDGLSEELLMSTARLHFSSKEELPVLLSHSSSLLFVLSSVLRCASFPIDSGVDWLAGREIPRLPVVEVVRFWRPTAAHCLMETMSSGIGST